MTTFEIREIDNKEDFDLSTLFEDIPFTQASLYGEWQENLGRIVKRFLISENGEIVAYFQLIKYPLLLGKSYLYAPYGPLLKKQSEDLLVYLKNALEKIARDEQAVFVRLDFTPPLPDTTFSHFFTKAPLYTYHSAYFQPRHEWVLGLEKTEDQILAGMHENHRYSIRLAERKGVVAEIITKDFQEHFEDFYKLMEETAKRNGFGLHQKKYYENVFQNLQKTGSYLSIAKLGDKILAIDLIIVFAKKAHYVFGGSSNEHRSLCPSYAAKWKAIRHAKTIGCLDYNFGGVATGDATYTGWDKLSTFKKKFGGREIVHSNFFDVVVSPFWYYLYNLRKRLKKMRA